TPVYGDDHVLTEACSRWYPGGVVPRLARASRLTRERRFAEADASLRELKAEYPSLPTLEEHLAVNDYDAGRLEDSAAHYEIVARDPLANAGTRLAYAELLVELGRNDEAISQLGQAFGTGRGDYRDLARARELR